MIELVAPCLRNYLLFFAAFFSLAFSTPLHSQNCYARQGIYSGDSAAFDAVNDLTAEVYCLHRFNRDQIDESMEQARSSDKNLKAQIDELSRVSSFESSNVLSGLKDLETKIQALRLTIVNLEQRLTELELGR